ncbi:MAG: DUF177 domain-containing protein [Bryobacteraceae bacterium]
MFLSVKDLEVRKVRFSKDFLPGEINFLEDTIRQVTPLHVEGEAELATAVLAEIHIQGKLTVEMECDCDRCLEPTRYPANSKFDLYYRPMTDEFVPGEVRLDAGDTEVSFYDDGGIELEEVLREHILLTLPMQKLCHEDCKGICPRCGQNRNAELCGCDAKPVDDRWQALSQVKLNLEKQ